MIAVALAPERRAPRRKYSPEQPRDEGGRWTDGGGGSWSPPNLGATAEPLDVVAGRVESALAARMAKYTRREPLTPERRAALVDSIRAPGDASDPAVSIARGATVQELAEDSPALERARLARIEAEERYELYRDEYVKAEAASPHGVPLALGRKFLDQADALALRRAEEADARRAGVYDALSAVKSVGGRLLVSEGTERLMAKDRVLRDAVRQVEGRLPSGLLATLDKVIIKRVASTDGNRAYYDRFGRIITIPKKYGAEAALAAVAHELGHHIEYESADIKTAIRRFYESRTGVPQGWVPNAVPLGAGYRDDELTHPDKFADPYIGNARHSEAFSMGLEAVLAPRSHIGTSLPLKDPEHYRLILGLLAKA